MKIIHTLTSKMVRIGFVFWVILLVNFSVARGQQDMEPEETEVWEPVPEQIDPKGFINKVPPSDAVILFDGQDLNNWESTSGEGQAEWDISDGYMTIVPGTGDIQTRQSFGSVQMHIEWRVPEENKGKGQDLGNSGIFLQGKYELQVLDSYDNKTYSNGMAGSIYKQHIPRKNAAREPGKWQSYDIIFVAPQFGQQGEVESPARMTVFWNGIMIHNDVTLQGPTQYIGISEYEPHADKLPIKLQDHDHPVSFRNIWVREFTANDDD